MRLSFARVKGLGFILWQSRHMGYHVLLGLVWAWFLREKWGSFNPKWVWTAIIGSLLPDIDHLQYFLGYGKQETYTKQIVGFLKARQWRSLAHFIATGHKYNTNLSYHNIYIVVILLGLALVSSRIDWEVGVILFGAMILHYLLDIFDDIVQLGTVNPNWKRWGKQK
ncbi:MAG: hypothetical protein ACD_36C00086G0003 [uncultured bacterium]|uniref:Uncharacterized protein n=1 Tax=Candidatus Gottesmanbacteria bacterium RIFCSPLOWO2_01_FULL_43_11b TaxID=1798392 RepID=A0A1F6AGN0_9BACT|nr:MAG: hypothetical protein ACD_36C00086G0003 [uncultured bacterium]OGG23841.1 MAG: hypothetical protein A3A79_01395 [Candidatus Gottesmanbacteria bacterium RIFCSPLOWO2_01_FULL_43_11b]